MFWLYTGILLVAVLGWAIWFDRRKRIRRINAPDRPLGGDLRADFSHELDDLVRPHDPDHSDH